MTLTLINEWLDELDVVVRNADIDLNYPAGWHVHGYYAGMTPLECLLAWINDAGPYEQPMPKWMEAQYALDVAKETN